LAGSYLINKKTGGLEMGVFVYDDNYQGASDLLNITHTPYVS
jgi:hypothetical protein